MITPAERAVLTNVLIFHWRRSDSTCGCGWGQEPQQLGASWPEHIVQVFEESVAHLDDALGPDPFPDVGT